MTRYIEYDKHGNQKAWKCKTCGRVLKTLYGVARHKHPIHVLSDGGTLEIIEE